MAVSTLGDYTVPVDGGVWYGCTKAITYAAGTTGAVGAKTIFTVTGTVRVRLFATVVTALTSGGSSTIEVGTTINTAGIIAQTTSTNLIAGEIYHDATPDASVELETVVPTKIVTESIKEKITTATVTGGAMVYSLLWQPVSADGNVVAA